MSISELEDIVNQDIINLTKKKEKIEDEIKQLPLLNEQNNDKFTKTLLSSEQSLIFLIEHSQRIEKSVEQTNLMSQGILKDFDNLKYRKINVENLINTMTTFTELKRIIPCLQTCLKDKDIKSMIKQCTVVQGFSDYLIEEFAQEQIQELNNLMGQLRSFAQEQFEHALKNNDAEKLNQSSQLSKILKLKETSLEQVIDVYSSNLKLKLKVIDDDFFEKVNLNYKSDENFSNYNYPFFEAYVKTLKIIYQGFQEYSENSYKFYGGDGIKLLLRSFINASSSVIQGIIKKMSNYYMIDQINKTQNRIDVKELNRLGIYCDELCGFSTYNETFNQQIQQDFKAMTAGQQPPPPDIIREIETMDMNNKIINLMGSFLMHQEYYLRQQIYVIMESNSYRCLNNFDKTFFIQFYDKKEELYNTSNLYEYLDELFYLISNSAKSSLSTLNKSIQCSVLNFLCHLIEEEIYEMVKSLTNKYIKKEYFTASAIGFNEKFTVHNAFIIILLNNLEMLLKYLKKLKQNMLHEYDDIMQDKQKESIVIHCISELNDHNQQIFSNFLKQQLELLVDCLKITIKPLIEEFKQLNFMMSEQVMVEYEKSQTFSQLFSSKISLYLVQWKVQLTKDNFSIFMTCFCDNLASTFEAIIMSKKFHQMGAMLLDKEIRDIVSFLSGVTTTPIKQHFDRLQLISEILMLENQSDMQEFYSERAKEGSPEDFKKIIRLRVTKN